MFSFWVDVGPSFLTSHCINSDHCVKMIKANIGALFKTFFYSKFTFQIWNILAYAGSGQDRFNTEEEILRP